jgi:FtsP/CotA-like multicopper oxidase with cupredoxin domain
MIVLACVIAPVLASVLGPVFDSVPQPSALRYSRHNAGFQVTPGPQDKVPAPASAKAAEPRFRRPPKAVDRNRDPKVFETVLIATEGETQILDGKKTPSMNFNGSSPGPTIEVDPVA